jgi:hypothetical protein
MRIFPIAQLTKLAMSFEAHYILEGAGTIIERIHASSEFQARVLIRSKYKGLKVTIIEMRNIREPKEKR